MCQSVIYAGELGSAEADLAAKEAGSFGGVGLGTHPGGLANVIRY
jgi:hypothetical protein